MKKDTNSLPGDNIEPLIRTIRGQKVILADDLARLYGVPTKRLNEQVKRNQERFPDDFMFQLMSPVGSKGTTEERIKLPHARRSFHSSCFPLSKLFASAAS